MSLRSDPEALRKYNRERAAKARREWMAGKSCVKCGSIDRLEVDHINPAEKVGHNVWSWSAERRAAELAKCQVLCSPCHHEKTRLDNWGERRHGTSGMYRNGRCRCADCREYARLEGQRTRALRSLRAFGINV